VAKRLEEVAATSSGPLSKSTDAALPSWRTIGNGPGEFMSDLSAQFVGVELYFEDLERAKKFYLDTLGLHLSDEQPGHYAKFAADAAFVCLETKGSESYPSRDKAVLFFEVSDLEAAVHAIGRS